DALSPDGASGDTTPDGASCDTTRASPRISRPAGSAGAGPGKFDGCGSSGRVNGPHAGCSYAAPMAYSPTGIGPMPPAPVPAGLFRPLPDPLYPMEKCRPLRSSSPVLWM